MIYNICGFYGYNNLGDEGILYAIVDEIREVDESPAIIVSTTLPSNQRDKYLDTLKQVIPETICVRDTYDTRNDYDVFLLGGGNLNWGYGWRLALSAFASRKKSMNYGVGYTAHMGAPLYHPKLNGLYREFLNQFDAVSVRDNISHQLLNTIGVINHLTMCPGINLNEKPHTWTLSKRSVILLDPEKSGDVVNEGSIVVCPRFEDSDLHGRPGNNEPQVNWIENRLKDESTPITLLNLAPGDLKLCQDIKWDIANPTQIVNTLDPRMAKYIISKAKLLISGGRYHAVLWAIAHNVPYELVPTGVRYEKVPELIETHLRLDGEALKLRERRNVELLKGLLTDLH